MAWIIQPDRGRCPTCGQMHVLYAPSGPAPTKAELFEYDCPYGGAAIQMRVNTVMPVRLCPQEALHVREIAKG